MAANTDKKLLGVSVLRLGDHGDNKRVWIVNKKLQKVFSPGEQVMVNYDRQTKTIVVERSEIFGTHTISHRGNGTPVLDIKNREVENTLGSGVEKIEVLYFENELVIKVSKNEIARDTRKAKTGFNTFELFSGAGTLSYFFKKQGFNVVGGLELNPEYQALFHENHEGDEIFSISGFIEDIHTSFFPKNVDIVLAGIPCTTYTNANTLLKQAQKAMREGREYDENEVKKAYEAEALTYYVLNAIRAMNPRTVVVEEVPGYSESAASMMLRVVLEQMGYNITETVGVGFHSKRKRWVLVADMNSEISLDNLIYDDDKVIEDFLEIPLSQRDWIAGDKQKRVIAMRQKSNIIGERFVDPKDKMCNVFTTHHTRHTEPILKLTNEELFSEFTNREIANIHGLGKDFVLDPRKSVSRQVIGQGVTDMFSVVAERIRQSHESIVHKTLGGDV